MSSYFLDILPDDAVAAFENGQRAYKLGEFAGAAAHYRAALKSAPQFAGGHFNLGLALDALRQPAEALAEFRAAQ